MADAYQANGYATCTTIVTTCPTNDASIVCCPFMFLHFYCPSFRFLFFSIFLLLFPLNTECSQDEFQCNSGQCIPLIDHCNSLDDCDDRSDELHCNGKLSNVTTTTLATVNGNIENSHISCPANQFMCNNGLCIPESSLCDDDNDCGNWEDETNCGMLSFTFLFYFD